MPLSRRDFGSQLTVLSAAGAAAALVAEEGLAQSAVGLEEVETLVGQRFTVSGDGQVHLSAKLTEVRHHRSPQPDMPSGLQKRSRFSMSFATETALPTELSSFTTTVRGTRIVLVPVGRQNELEAVFG